VPVDQHERAAPRAPADAIGTVPGSSVHGTVVEPAGDGPGDPRTTPSGEPRARRRLVGLAAAIVLAAGIAVPLTHHDTIAGTPVPAPGAIAAPTDPTETTCTGTRTLVASGSALQHDAVLAIADRWQDHCRGTALRYTAGGTSLGVQQFATGETDFAVVDHPLGENQGEIASAAARCAGTGAPANKDLVLQLPMIFTPIVLTYDLPGVAGLRLDAPTVSAIFSARITKWNDRTIARLNPDVRLPATAITVITRAGLSQTTQTFQEYLAAAGGWRSGAGPEFTGRANMALLSDTDVLAAVRANDGAIAYLPATSTRPTDEPVVALVTGGYAASPVSYEVNTVMDSVLNTTYDLTTLPAAIFRAGTQGYPLVHVGYVVACEQYQNDARPAAIRDFLMTALSMGAAPASGYQLPFGGLQRLLVNVVDKTY
jgi:phosphate transport system substrate-binding protein